MLLHARRLPSYCIPLGCFTSYNFRGSARLPSCRAAAISIEPVDMDPFVSELEPRKSDRLAVSYPKDSEDRPRLSSALIDCNYLSCCQPGEKLNIGVLLSGGVDSSVALRLLLAAGHSCSAFYLKIWFQEDFENFWASCPWDEDLKFAQAVCDEVGVKLHIVQLTDEYWENVVAYMIAEYKAGRTPNPDVLCNSRIKFGVFLDYVKKMGFDRVASGHYAKVACSSNGETLLRLSNDEGEVRHLAELIGLPNKHRKDSQGICFLGKGEVRHLAELIGLPNKHRKDSQGICFLGKVKFNDFICRHLGEKEGQIIEAETGNYLGIHRGYWFHTIGQRQGLCLSNGPWYVVDKDLENNVIFVSREYYSGDKKRRAFIVDSMSWISGAPPRDLLRLKCKVRHGPRLYGCSLTFIELDGNTSGRRGCPLAEVHLTDDDQGIAAGQFAAFYDEDVCVGSGVISEFKSDVSLAVSAQAREAAKAKDVPLPSKSKTSRKKKHLVHRTSTPEDGWFVRLQGWWKSFFTWG